MTKICKFRGINTILFTKWPTTHQPECSTLQILAGVEALEGGLGLPRVQVDRPRHHQQHVVRHVHVPRHLLTDNNFVTVLWIRIRIHMVRIFLVTWIRIRLTASKKNSGRIRIRIHIIFVTWIRIRMTASNKNSGRIRIRIQIRIKVISWIRIRNRIRITLQMRGQNVWNMSLF
jgi:hypothetical protein